MVANTFYSVDINILLGLWEVQRHFHQEILKRKVSKEKRNKDSLVYGGYYEIATCACVVLH